MKKLIFLIGLLLSPLTHSGELPPEPLESYTARLSANDHYNSDGERLKTVAAIIRQDRANYHKFNVRDNEDQGDRFFADKNNRDRLESLLKKGHLDKETQERILNGTPTVLINIYKNYIEVYLQ